MAIFKDRNGKPWAFSVNVNSIKRCRELVGISPLDIVSGEGDVLKDLANNQEKIADMLYACCKPDIEAAGLSDVQFGELLTADSLDEGWEGLKAEAVGFSQKSRQPLMRKVMEKQQEVEGKAIKMAMAKLDDPKLMETLEADLAAKLDEALQISGSTSATNTAAT